MPLLQTPPTSLGRYASEGRFLMELAYGVPYVRRPTETQVSMALHHCVEYGWARRD